MSSNTAADLKMQPNDVRCSYSDNKSEHEYPHILNGGTFCLIARTARLVQTNLLESLASGCIPVIMADNVVMPFSEVKTTKNLPFSDPFFVSCLDFNVEIFVLDY